MKRRLIRGSIVIEILILLVAGTCLVKSVIATTELYRFLHLPSLALVDGRVKAVSRFGFTLNLDFSLPETNEVIVIQQSVFIPKYNVGDHMAVLYNTIMPGMAHINGWNALLFDPLALAVPGLVLLFWGFRMFAARSL